MSERFTAFVSPRYVSVPVRSRRLRNGCRPPATGGGGAVSVRRGPYTPRGGPNGGDGGRGGDVVLEVSSGVRDLAWFADHPHQRATSGQKGSGNNRRGAGGEDLVLRVPDGTVVRDE